MKLLGRMRRGRVMAVCVMAVPVMVTRMTMGVAVSVRVPVSMGHG